MEQLSEATRATRHYYDRVATVMRRLNAQLSRVEEARAEASQVSAAAARDAELALASATTVEALAAGLGPRIQALRSEFADFRQRVSGAVAGVHQAVQATAQPQVWVILRQAEDRARHIP